MLEEIAVQTTRKIEFIEITPKIQKLVQKSKVREGHCILYCPHTTAAVLTNENADGGNIWKDIEEMLERIAPQNKQYHHDDGNAHAHLKAALLGNSKTILIHNFQLVLGTWEGIFLAEFDGPRKTRRVLLRVVSAP